MNWSKLTLQLIAAACEEDLGAGDITSALLPGGAQPATGRVVARQAGVLCGLAVAPTICGAFARRIDERLVFATQPSGPRAFADGDPVAPGDVVATVHGPKALVLAAERTLLNFLGRMSGVATQTQRYVAAARSGNATVQVLDTRKTIPGWRELDKYAVRAGGGHNHRRGLYDAVLIKDNHLAGIPSDHLAQELTRLLNVHWPEDLRPGFVEVEVDSLAQLEQVVRVPGVDIVLLDNFSLHDLRAAVTQRDGAGLRGRVALEASGGVTLNNIAAIAATGVDRVSVGALTHSASSLDLALDL